MLRRKDQPNPDAMSRQETALWLGRALSTNEIALRALLQTIDVIHLQQQVIQQLYQQLPQGSTSNGQPAEIMAQMEQGLSENLQTRLSELREQLDPILKMVDDSCQTLEKML